MSDIVSLSCSSWNPRVTASEQDRAVDALERGDVLGDTGKHQGSGLYNWLLVARHRTIRPWLANPACTSPAPSTT